MISASQLRAGMAIRFEGQLYRVVGADYHPGQGKMGGVCHARLKNLSTGTFWEHSFRSDLKLEELPSEKRPMTYLYTDADGCWFMDEESFDQINIPEDSVGQAAVFLQPEMRLAVDFVEGKAVGVHFPDSLDVRIADTAPPTHSQTDSTWKPAKLENGVEVMVPQFIKTGDAIRLDLASLRYMDRAKGAGK
jgi:elongation factor P